MAAGELIVSARGKELLRFPLTQIKEDEWLTVGDSQLCDIYCSLIAPSENIQVSRVGDFVGLQVHRKYVFGYRRADYQGWGSSVCVQIHSAEHKSVRDYALRWFPHFSPLFLQRGYEDLKVQVMAHFNSEWLSQPLDFNLLADIAAKVSLLVCSTVSDCAKVSLALLTDVFLEGALSEILADHEVTEVAYNGDERLWMEKNGKWCEIPFPFLSWDVFERWLLYQSSRAHAELYNERHFSDFVLRCGARVHVSLPPVARSRCYVTIRSHIQSSRTLSVQDFNFEKTAHCSALCSAFEQRKNILIVGSTGSGKTTLLRFLLEQSETSERILVLEDTPELNIARPHVVYLQTSTQVGEQVTVVTLYELVRESLRMRPDRIVVGECRGSEAFALLQALHTGHRGALCTLHASSVADALDRFQTLVMQAHPSLSASVVRRMILSSIDVVVVLKRSAEGSRSVAEVCELSGGVPE